MNTRSSARLASKIATTNTQMLHNSIAATESSHGDHEVCYISSSETVSSELHDDNNDDDSSYTGSDDSSPDSEDYLTPITEIEDGTDAHDEFRIHVKETSSFAFEGFREVDDVTGAEGENGEQCDRPLLSKQEQDSVAEALEKIRSGADLKKLTLEQCKAYLRNYGLRLSGSKAVLIDRIQHHLEIKDGGGMMKYPRWTFTIDCTGDACTGDVVLFKQRIYDKFNIASRSSTLPPLGIRLVAARIVKESYGAAKQQHTFTVEVLWSTGIRPLPPLYPLIIKGRNLYRLRTFRQPWSNEEERRRILEEKHNRGTTARSTRVARLERKKHHRSTDKSRVSRERSKAVRADAAVVTTAHRINVEVPTTIDLQQSGRRKYGQQALAGNSIKATKVVSSSTQNYIDDNKSYSTPFSVFRMSIKACLAGIIIGRHGSNINQIIGATGAKLHVSEDKTNPAVRVVEIMGTPEQIDLAKEMVLQKVRVLEKTISSKPGYCKHSARGNCRFGNSCRFAHG